MNLQTLVLLALRLMGLNMLASSLIYSVSMLVNTRLDSAGSLASALVIPFTSMVVAACLLAFAPSIAPRIIKEDARISFGSLSLVDCYTVAFSAVGLYYLALYIPNGLNWIFYLFRTAIATPGTEWQKNVPWSDLVNVAGWIFAGSLLLFNSRRWAVALANKTTPRPEAAPNATS